LPLPEEVMHVWTAAALVVTVLVGGLIAYLGDIIGRRFGKRRASIFGLRPRHTAVLITSVTGVLISLVTTAVLFLAVQPVRRVILEGEAAIRSSGRLRRENAQLQEINRRARQAAQRARAERETALRERRKALNELQIAQAELRSARQSLTQALAAARRAQRQRQLAEAAVRRARDQVRQERLASAELAQRNEALRAKNEELRALSEELNRRNEGLRKENASLTATNAAYSQENAAVAQQNEALIREQERLTATIADLRKQQQDLEQQTQELKAQYDELMRSYATAYGAHRSLAEMFDNLRNRRIAIHTGEELARVVIPPNTPPAGVRDAISRLLNVATLEALKKGAAPGERARAVEIVDRRFTAKTPTGVTTVRVTEQDRIDAIVARLARSPEPVCLLAVAVSNTAEGEPGAIDLQPLPNPLIYRKGQVIAIRKIDSARPAGEVFDELVSILKGVGQSALGRGLIPRTDPLTGEPQVGSLSGAQIVNLTTRILSAGRRSELAVLTAADVRAADTLDLEFRVRPSL